MGPPGCPVGLPDWPFGPQGAYVPALDQPSKGLVAQLGATCLSHLSKDRRAEKVTPISVTPQGDRSEAATRDNPERGTRWQTRAGWPTGPPGSRLV